ncbi:ClpP/crotonase-like domain-containing protein [Aspergillus navahoensis]
MDNQHMNSDKSTLTFPATTVLLVTLSRPKDLNCINSTVGIITGEGRAFCAGADLKEWNASTQLSMPRSQMPLSGFGGLSRRSGKKPVIAAVNGLCLDGGCEMITKTDIRGVVAWAGALPRIVRTAGKQRAMEMVLTGRKDKAKEAERWGFVNEVVNAEKVVERAIEVAVQIAGNIGAEDGTRLLVENWEKKLNAGENIKEGLRAFVEKRKPEWKESKL